MAIDAAIHRQPSHVTETAGDEHHEATGLAKKGNEGGQTACTARDGRQDKDNIVHDYLSLPPTCG